jgi:hypothetical protein
MIIEFFGLSKSGKSILKNKLREKGLSVSEEFSDTKKTFFFLKSIIFHPIKSVYLFYKLNTNHLNIKGESSNFLFKSIKMRNFYLAGVLAKHEFFKKNKRIFIDEFSYQSVFMILNKKSCKSEIFKLLNSLPKSDYVLLFDRSKELRSAAYRKKHPFKSGATLMPGSWISRRYAIEWMKIMEYNFSIMKRLIRETYKKTSLPEIKTSYPEVYLAK